MKFSTISCLQSFLSSLFKWKMIKDFSINMINNEHELNSFDWIFSTKTNYLNYLKTEHIINMMLALHSDCQEQMRSIIDMMLTSEREVIIIISQKNSVKTKDIQKKLHKLQVFYEFNECKNNELMLWEKMRNLTEIIEKLMHQRIVALTVNQHIKNQLKRLKKIMSRLEKRFMKKRKHVDSWAKKASVKSTTSFESHLVFNINISSSVQNYCKKFEVKIFIKEKEEIKRIMMITTKNIVKWAKKIDVDKTLSMRKNIKTMKRWLRLLIFQVKMKSSKRTLKKNNFWIKKISLNACLHEISFEIVIHEIKVEEMSKNIKKKEMRMLIKINKDIHSKMMIKKIKWLTKKSEQKRYISLMRCIVSAEMINKLINEKVCHEIDIKITQFYDSSCRVHQCLKYQEYDHKMYECKNKQRCIYCMLNHHLKHCSYKQIQNMWKCEVCWDTHRVFNSQCHKQQAEKERIKRVIKYKSLYHVVWEQKELKATMSKIFIKTFINLKSLMNNDLKRKQRHSINESHLLNTIVTSENIILNHLIKKSRSHESKSTLITLLSMSSSVENLTSEVNALQTLKKILNSLKCEF